MLFTLALPAQESKQHSTKSYNNPVIKRKRKWIKVLLSNLLWIWCDEWLLRVLELSVHSHDSQERSFQSYTLSYNKHSQMTSSSWIQFGKTCDCLQVMVTVSTERLDSFLATSFIWNKLQFEILPDKSPLTFPLPSLC